MQTCKPLRLVVYHQKPIDFNNYPDVNSPLDMSAYITTVNMEIPSGTYVTKVEDKKYRVNAWRGMPKEYKETINRGVVITYNQVKGK